MVISRGRLPHWKFRRKSCRWSAPGKFRILVLFGSFMCIIQMVHITMVGHTVGLFRDSYADDDPEADASYVIAHVQRQFNDEGVFQVWNFSLNNDSRIFAEDRRLIFLLTDPEVDSSFAEQTLRLHPQIIFWGHLFSNMWKDEESGLTFPLSALTSCTTSASLLKVISRNINAYKKRRKQQEICVKHSRLYRGRTQSNGVPCLLVSPNDIERFCQQKHLAFTVADVATLQSLLTLSSLLQSAARIKVLHFIGLPNRATQQLPPPPPPPPPAPTSFTKRQSLTLQFTRDYADARPPQMTTVPDEETAKRTPTRPYCNRIEKHIIFASSQAARPNDVAYQLIDMDQFAGNLKSNLIELFNFLDVYMDHGLVVSGGKGHLMAALKRPTAFVSPGEALRLYEKSGCLMRGRNKRLL